VKIKTRNKKMQLQNLKEITPSTHTGGCEYLLPYLPGNGARKELDVYALLFL
jgi:hypothetical protein